MTRSRFAQTNAYAMQWGGLFGLYWSVGLACMVKGFALSGLHSLAFLIIFSVPFVGFWLAQRFERKVGPEEPITWGRAYLFSFLIYFYASLVLAFIALLYFRFLDNGAFIEANIAQLQTPESRQLLDQPEIKNQMDAMLQATGASSLEEVLRQFTPTVIVAQIFNMNFLLALVLALPTAFFGMSRRHERP